MISTYICLFAMLFAFQPEVTAATKVPDFQPNIVEGPTSYLSDTEKQEINSLIEQMRKKPDIWAAVYVVDVLQDESIEELADRAFKKWQLGEKGKDNGLLLLLAMGDRKMRIETGYGLEGDIPDSVARTALDDYLRPYLRQGKTADGIKNAFRFLASRRDANFAAEGVSLPSGDVDLENDSSGDRLLKGYRWGLAVWGLYAFLLLFYPLFGWMSGSTPKPSDGLARSLGGFGLKIFFIINPGVFIFFLFSFLGGNPEVIINFFRSHAEAFKAAGVWSLVIWLLPTVLSKMSYAKKRTLLRDHPELHNKLTLGSPIKVLGHPFQKIFFSLLFALPIVLLYRNRMETGVVFGGLVAFALFINIRSSRKYASAKAFNDYWASEEERKRKEREALIKKGHAIVNSKGELEYTRAYYASRSSSSSSSSSGGSSSSSSGGGSSGGGGSSSSW